MEPRCQSDDQEEERDLGTKLLDVHLSEQWNLLR